LVVCTSTITPECRKLDQTDLAALPLATAVSVRAFSGEVDTGSPLENAIKQREIERSPIPLKRDSI
jgi:hypothetical protein